MSTVKNMDKLGLLKRNFNNPPMKDTSTVPVGGYTIIRFLTNNPGTWLFHCHLEFHSEIGMAFIIKVGDQWDLPSMPRNWPQCGNYKWQGVSNGSGNKIKSPVTNKQVIFLIFNIIFILFLF